ncbi:FAD-dependent 5-carboxymethylaminomethyl-2-thiouridine(34) oxidoreductase MnmC [Marinobacter sediminicola]|uniref:FAD-dependent 5-carboxymethylaminomethyl-2-thiouridine(34) oxidoreductase MnmC n=1 Tax=Marinobacter sediminicola TaxID=3072994 RepID=UPI002811D2E7|nr:FAD-dependent 5-carboxymethylaminomethyl-2-thiouridine(34) oxidoreductase MnmC [Marinobacter sp. F26243]
MNPSPAPPAITPAELGWFDDVSESSQAYIKLNDLPARFAALPEAGCFVVAENSFRSGLNFLAAWQAWRAFGPSHSATLHFISAARCPLSRQDLEKVLSRRPELREFSDELIANYPALIRGTHRLVLEGGRVRLTLIFGARHEAYDTVSFLADAWFFNVGSPAESRGACPEETTNHIHKFSRPGTTLAAPQSTQACQIALEKAGFLKQACNSLDSQPDSFYGIFQPGKGPSPAQSKPAEPGMSVAVIGAGIAGCLLANNLAQRGYSVTLVDAADDAGSAASGNLQGAMYVKLGVEFNHQTELALSALTFSQRFYSNQGGPLWHPTGLLQLAWSDGEQDRQRRFIERNQYPKDVLRQVSREEAETLTGAALESGGLWFPGSGWLEPGKLCNALAMHPRIHKMFGCSITKMVATGDQWRLALTNNDSPNIQANRVVICAGHLSPLLIPGSGAFRFKAIRGQVTHLPEALAASPSAVICGARYLNPAHGLEGQRQAVIGATFDLHDREPEPTTESHRENIRALSAMVPQMLPPGMASSDLPERLTGRVGFRCTTHDYQPVAGPFYDGSGVAVSGLYLFTGLGSKGLTYAPLLAEFMADQISGQPTALPRSLAKKLATARMHRPNVASS